MLSALGIDGPSSAGEVDMDTVGLMLTDLKGPFRPDQNLLTVMALHLILQAIADVSDLLKDGLLQDSEILAIWKTVSKADAVRDRVDFRGFAKAFAQVDALFEEEEEVLDSSDGVAASSESGNRVDSEAAREAVVGEVGEAEASFRALVGSSQGMLDLAGLLR